MESSDTLHALRRHAVIIGIAGLIGAGAAGAYFSQQDRVYTAEAAVFVSTQSAASVSELTQGSTYTQQVVQSYAAIVREPIVLAPVIDSLGLDTTPDRLARSITAIAPLDRVTITVEVNDTSPERAADIANAVTASLGRVVAELTPGGDEGAPVVKVTTVREAAVPSTPIAPRVSLMTAVGGFVGLLVGTAFALVRDAASTRIRGTRDISRVTELPVLGMLRADRAVRSNPLVVATDPTSPRSEAFRKLRTNLQFLDNGRASKAFVITSSVESEGKSTAAVNLAIAAAKTGKRVLLVDADLRRPRAADLFGIDSTVGLSDVLIGEAELNTALQRWGDDNLYVLPAGSVPPNPSELLQSQELASLLTQLKKRFSTIILDAPPLLPVPDAAILSRKASGAIVVCAVKRVRQAQLKGALDTLDRIGAKTFGIVLTMTSSSGAGAAGYGEYRQGSASGHQRRGDRRPTTAPPAAPSPSPAAERVHDDVSAHV